MSTTIHPSALVDEGAELGEGVTVGPFCHVGGHVKLGDHTKLESHVVVAGRTTVGAGCHIFPFASIGHRPQDLKYHGEPSTLEIGANTTMREYVTVQPGTEHGGMITRVGEQCLLMASAHVAHDCQVGNQVILGNNVMMAGHCTVEDHVIVSGGSAAHQFVRIGEHAFVGGLTGVENDVIPYGMIIGNRGNLSGLNIVGLRRRGFDRDEIHTIRQAYRLLFSDEGTLAERVEDVSKMFPDSPSVKRVIDFIRSRSDRALCLPHSGD
ncbi:acyl-ACP--UDP-N-acetylglucosamine O-acyltransferase [Ahrensia marina]|uniref:acyl-ACP--UDP-N-acetylglucosamine O-acyltransferase n=1 Tax=Ahrensia marina TaxID=1514904 RepID=UPI0035D06AE1